MVDEARKAKILALLQERSRLVRYGGQMHQLFPEDGPYRRDLYPRHMQFFELGARYRERCFMGGNGTGKTLAAGGYETSLHATGEYPDWWPGCRFDTPIDCWVAGDTKETVRDITQSKLIGDVAKHGLDALGTGLIPKDRIVNVKFKQNTNYAADFAVVKHVRGQSVIAFKSYDQRREAFQGTEKHWIWLDEEPPEDIYGECLMRGRTVGGKLAVTFTPLSGYTQVVDGFLKHEAANAQGASKALVMCGWAHVPHLSEQEKRELLAATPPHMRASREHGVPTAGMGKVYTVAENEFVVTPFPIPAFWRRAFGFDWGRLNTAVVWGALDPDNDILYLYAEYKRGEVEIPIHASAIKGRGRWIPGVGDAAAINAADGEQILKKFRDEGVLLQLADKSVTAGIEDVWARLSTGRLKVFSTLEKWLEEYRTYSYDNDEKTKINKTNDHLMDATRYLVRSGLKVARLQREERGASTSEETFGLYA